MNTNILIIGAGIAGLCAAKEATAKGDKVVVIEQKEDVSTNGVEYITKTNLRQLNIKSNPDWILNTTDGFTLNSPDNNRIVLDDSTIAMPEKSYIVDLDKFNKDLKKMALDSNAEIYFNTKATGISRNGSSVVVTVDNTDIGEITTDILIIAEGLDSNMTKEVNLDYDLSDKNTRSIVQYKVKSVNVGADNNINMYFGSVAPGGYAWILPVDENNAYIGLSTLNSNDSDSEELLDNFLSEKLDDYTIIDKESRILPINGISRERVDDNIMITGDAAGFINPLTNMKLEDAIASGIYAGVVAGELIFTGEDLDKVYMQKFTMYTDMLINEDTERYNETRKFLLSLSDDDFNIIASQLENAEMYESDIDNIIRYMIENCSKPGLQLKNLYA
ncbi:NAD(P)/FAD-dependent oxidoreductase [Methanosphaera sp.]|jgi:digeranylgeranylglycerophospholipid reductase|uniref:NAD(P)/FAD-dependent oxidoreductase n=1 Tax=Methanosphaera sp. TaxID=2666342 RepID=UPI002A53FEF9|nr:NAD(P)/FAD-dependent oxidoreductase [Methanobacteriaceae archaeon]